MAGLYIIVAFKLEIEHYEDVSPCLATRTCVAMIHMRHGSTHQVLHCVFTTCFTDICTCVE